MSIPEYEYTVELCDVPSVRRASLTEYREFRRKCLEYIRGDSETSVANQIHSLVWHTAIFRTLNEARRIEPDRPVNGPMWDLITTGYAHLMTLGIRRLVDKHPRTDSIWNVIAMVERRPELLTREKFVCYDGLPYDYEAAFREYVRSRDGATDAGARWVSMKGPQAWGASRMLHEAFDALSGYPKKRRRTDVVKGSIISALKQRLSDPAIEKVCTMADRRIAHAERTSRDSDAVPIATYNDIDDALRTVVRVTNFLSSSFFYDTDRSFPHHSLMCSNTSMRLG